MAIYIDSNALRGATVDRRMRWLHIACRAAAAGVVRPFGQLSFDPIGIAAPDEEIGAAGFFFEQGRLVEACRNGFADKAKRLVIHHAPEV